MNMEDRAAWMAFITAFITLGTQILVHRIITAKLLNNYAFLVISLTMLGFAFSGAILSRRLKLFLDNLNDAVSVCVSSFVISLVFSGALFYHIPLGTQIVSSRLQFLQNFTSYMLLALLFAVPFAFCGFILGALLSLKKFPTNRIYFFDLLGSSIGAMIILPALILLGVEANILLLLWVFLIVSTILFPPTRVMPRWIGYGTFLFLILSSFFHANLFKMSYPEGSMLSRSTIEHIAWDPIARIEVLKEPENVLHPDTFRFPCLIGGDMEFIRQFKKSITQNNFAFTFAIEYNGDVNTLKGIRETIYSAAYIPDSVSNPRAVIIGVGGGFDILTALYYRASEITGVEINAATIKILNDTYKDYFNNWVSNPKVNLVHEEGRHFLSQTDKKYDIIQLSGVDSYAGTAALANIFSESYLYTEEAMSLFFSRLSENGIINMMRLEFGYYAPREMFRALTTAVGVLRKKGIQNPAEHIVMLTSSEGHYTAMLIKKSPFNHKEISRLRDWASGNKYFNISACPGMDEKHAFAYQRFLSLGNPIMEKRVILNYPFNVVPAVDDKPFFFRHSYWWHLFAKDPIIRGSIPVLEYSLIVLFLLIGFASVLCIYMPLRGLIKATRKHRDVKRYGIVVALIGIGFMVIEISLMQKYGLFLGHPNYAISVVLASLLFSTGIGSIYCRSILLKLGKIRYVSYILVLTVVAVHFFVLPHLLSFISISFILKIILVFFLIFPIGICLGVFMPATLDRLKEIDASFVPWAWGVNGIFSVISPIICIGLSVTFGFSFVLFCSLPIYLAAGMIFPDNE